MIAKYKDQYFCIDLTIRPVEIWRYDAVAGFEKFIDDNLVYYSKFIDIAEIDEIFECQYSVKWKGSTFDAPFFKEDTVYLRTGDRDEADKYAFQEEIFDRGNPIVWYKIVDIAEVDEFRLYKKNYCLEYFTEKNRDAKQISEFTLSKENWLNMREKTEYELSPWNYKTNKN